MSPPECFKTDDKVEVRSDEEGFRGAYFEARVVRFLPKVKRCTVEYDALVDDADESRLLRETVDARHVRPRPPRHLLCPTAGGGGRFALHQPVDAFHNEAWWVGVVWRTPKNRETRYTVCFPTTREELKFGVKELRPHLEWVDGEWAWPEDQELSKTPYEAGTQVEVARIKHNAPVAWFSAVVLKTIWKNSLLVEYLKTIDGTDLLKEIVDLQHVRPCPPEEPQVNFSQLDEVEALYMDGWWPGMITKINSLSSYMVKLVHRDDEIEFCHTQLRHRFELVNSLWVKKPKNTVVVKFREGEQVEVCSDDEGFCGAWFTAIVIRSIGKDKFLIKYQDLKTDDEQELLKETVDSQHIRPTPPEGPVVDSYKYLEEVDAFYNDGWWIGVVSKVLKGQRYLVYFRPWKEEMEFAHEDLRLHQDWIDGKWARASKGWL